MAPSEVSYQQNPSGHFAVILLMAETILFGGRGEFKMCEEFSTVCFSAVYMLRRILSSRVVLSNKRRYEMTSGESIVLYIDIYIALLTV